MLRMEWTGSRWRLGVCVRFCSFLLGGTLVTPIKAQILSGTISNYTESTPGPRFRFGDGTHSVSLWWSVNVSDASGYFYATVDTEVAFATGVSAIGQISDASSYSFRAFAPPVGPVFDVPSTGGEGSFVVLRSATDGFYGVVRVDDVFAYDTPINHGTYECYSGLNATWWFQSNGSGDFTAVPEPPASALLVLSGCALLWVARRRQKVASREARRADSGQ